MLDRLDEILRLLGFNIFKIVFLLIREVIVNFRDQILDSRSHRILAELNCSNSVGSMSIFFKKNFPLRVTGLNLISEHSPKFMLSYQLKQKMC